jgi:ribosomal protein S18 acetylase RimI-like enzyme
MSSILPDGFHIRAPTTEDLDALAELFIAHERARFGRANWSVSAAREWIASVWETTGFSVARDARVVIAPTGETAGYITLWRATEESGFLVASPRILPLYQPFGLDAALLHWAESLAREKAVALPDTTSATLNSWVDGPDQASENMLTGEGFHLAQRYLRMEITLHAPPPAPEWPDGAAARPLVAGQDERAVFDLMHAAFNDSPGYHPWPFDEWSRDVLESESSDTSLWTLAAAGDQLVGAVINRVDTGDDGRIGWLEDVGVHPAWRKRGLGLAMLYQSFATFYERGVTRCGLSVDAHNASGATRLYERAGMTAQPRQEIRYEKPLSR